MVKNKFTTSVMRADQAESKIIGARLPSVRMPLYSSSRIVVCDQDYIVALLHEDLDTLGKDLKLKQSSGEQDLLPFVLEAIEYCKTSL